MKMKENLSGKAFVRQIEQGKYMRAVVSLSSPVNRPVLSEAFERAIRDCPFFDRTLIEKDGGVCYAPHRTDCRIRTLHEEWTITGAPGGDLVHIAAEDKTIVIGIAHAMTDGFGLNVLCRMVLYHYFCLLDQCDYPKPKEYAADGRIRFDEEADLLADLAVTESGNKATAGSDQTRKTTPGEECEPVLQLQEAEPFGSATFVLDADAAQFRRSAKETLHLTDESWSVHNRNLISIGGVSCVFTAHLMARVIEKVLPQNTKAIGCRFPVNARSIFGKQTAMRNFSLPQAVLLARPTRRPDRALSVGDADGRLQEREAEEMLAGLMQQISPERLKEQLLDLRAAIEGKQHLSAETAWRFAQTFLVSNGGRIAYEPERGRVTYVGYHYPGFPLMIYLSRNADRQFLTITQTFSSDRYVNGLIRELGAAGITDCSEIDMERLRFKL